MSFTIHGHHDEHVGYAAGNGEELRAGEPQKAVLLARVCVLFEHWEGCTEDCEERGDETPEEEGRAFSSVPTT